MDILGELHGQAPPEEWKLQRLADISDKFRVSWTPATPTRGARWWIHEVVPVTATELRRMAAGRAKLDRMTRWDPDAFERRRGEWYHAEWMARGWHYVGDYEPAFFGTDGMIRELFTGQALIRQAAKEADLAAAREAAGRADVADEETDNPAFRAHVRDLAEDWYPQVTGTRHYPGPSRDLTEV